MTQSIAHKFPLSVASDSDESAGARAPLQEVHLVELDCSYLEEVCSLEPRCYPHPWSSRLIEGEFEKEVSFRLGVRCERGLAAYAFSYLVPDEMHVLNLAVAPEYRGIGLGKFLLAGLLQRGVLRGAKTVTLEVRESNVIAQRLYFGLGFRRIGIRRNYYRDNGENALLLERHLASGDFTLLEQKLRKAVTRARV